MTTPTVLIAGASRGLGHALAAEFAARGWQVIGTVRDPQTRTPLHELADASDGTVTVQQLDVDSPEQIAALAERLRERTIDLLFVNAGTTTHEDVPLTDVSTQEFISVMVTNALSPLRVIGGLEHLVPDDGLIGVMTSGQGSITNNTNGLRQVYRGSKAALNQNLRSYAAQHADSGRAFALIAPGWIKTALGGQDAPYTIEENVPMIVDVLEAKRSRPGLEYLDFRGETVPW